MVGGSASSAIPGLASIATLDFNGSTTEFELRYSFQNDKPRKIDVATLLALQAFGPTHFGLAKPGAKPNDD